MNEVMLFIKKRHENSSKVSLPETCRPESVEGFALPDRRWLPRTGHGPRSPLGRTALLIAAGVLAFFWPAGAAWGQTGPDDDVGPLAKVTLHLGKASLTTGIAATSAQQERGLMYVSRLPDNDGMIFLLPRISTATFWMKNTLIPLSVAFIDKDGVILEIHDMKPHDETVTRSDSDKVAYALETNLHWFALNGVKPGDKIDPPPATLGKPLR
jgi:uncharacterized membrane protein (UPF0127 family)